VRHRDYVPDEVRAVPGMRDQRRLVSNPQKLPRLRQDVWHRAAGLLANLRASLVDVVRATLRLVGLVESAPPIGTSSQRLASAMKSIVVVLALFGLFAVGFALARFVHRPPGPCSDAPRQATTIQALAPQANAAQCPTIPCTCTGIGLRSCHL